MAEKKKRTNKKPEDLQNDLLEQNRKNFIAEMEKLEEKYGLQVAVKLVYAEAGLIPRIFLMEKPKNEQKTTD